MRSYRISLFTIVLAFTLSGLAVAQEAAPELPSAEISDMNGKIVNTTNIAHPDANLLILTWETGTPGSLLCLDAISMLKDSIAKATRTKVVMINFDPAADLNKVKATAKEHQWNFDGYVDPKQDFKNAAAISFLPVVLIVDRNNKIVYRKAAFYLGDEQTVMSELKKLSR